MSWRRGILSALIGLTVAARAADEAEEKISPWSFDATVGEAAGYKDNLLLSDLNKEASSFTLTTADLFLFHMPLNGWEMSLLATGEDRRYWQSSSMDKEQLFITALDVKKTLAEIWKPGFNLQYFYSDQIFDASVEQGLPFRIQAKLHRFSGGPTLALALPNKRRLETKFEFVRSNFEQPLDDYWEGGPRFLFGQKYGHNSDLTFSLAYRERAYDTLTPPTKTVALRYNIREVELADRHYFDKARQWSTRTRLGLEWTEDNGLRSNNYRRWREAGEVSFQRNRFEARAEARALHYEYPVGTGVDGRVRRRTELTFGARVKQEIFKGFRLFAEYEYEWVIARDVTEAYRVNTYTTGVEWDLK
jgi:hypothetical protein